MQAEADFIKAIIPLVAAILSGAIALYNQRKPEPKEAIERIKTREIPVPVSDILRDNTARIIVLERETEVLGVRLTNVESGQDRMEKKLDAILFILVGRGEEKK